MLFLSIDFGTSAVKLSIVNEDLKVLSWAKEEYPFLALPGEKNEIQPDKLWRALFMAAGKFERSLLDQVELVCYDTFSPSPVFMDEQGDLVYPNIITHLDRRSRAQSADISRLLGNDAYMNISGIYPFPGGCSAMTFLWFKQRHPEILDRSCRLGHLTTYIHKKLTGRWMVDLVNASMMGTYETTTQGGWSAALLSELGLPQRLFSDILLPGQILGALLPEMALSLGLRAGLPVAAGTNDMAAAQMGAGNKSSGQIMNCTGSSEMVSILTDRPIVNPSYYLRNAALPGLWQIYATTAGGFAVDWFYQEFCREMTREQFFAYVAQVVDGEWNDDITFEPYLAGDRQSLEKRSGAWRGLTLTTSRDEMLAALLRSIQGVLRGTIDQAARVCALDRVIKVSGGMANPAYLRLKQKEIPGFDFLEVDDCSILGNVALVKHYA